MPVKIMTQKNKNKQAEALVQELKEINRQAKELREKLKALDVRKSEVKMQLEVMGGKPIERNKDTPLYALVNNVYLDDYTQMLAKWQTVSEDKIQTKTAKSFNFKPNSISFVMRILIKTMAYKEEPPFFTIGQRSLCRYLESHSNLGSADNIRKVYQRELNKVGTKIYWVRSTSVK